MNEREVAWAAGFFDGEGTVTLSPYGQVGRPDREVRRRLRISVSQKHRAPLEVFQRLFGGTIHRSNERCFAWHANSRIALAALRELLPYLVVKREVAELGIRHQTNMRTGGSSRWDKLSPTEVAERQHCWSEIHRLNQRLPA